MSVAACDDENVVVIQVKESKEIPGMFCAIAYQGPFVLRKLFGNEQTRYCSGIQYSGWFSSEVLASTDLALKLKLEGFRKV